MRTNKVYSLLGMAQKSGNLVSGEFMTEKAIKNGSAAFAIVAEDASDNTKKMFRNSCEWYEVEMEVYGTKEELGHAIGKEFRASLAITDMGFAKSLKKKLATVNNDMEVK